MKKFDITPLLPFYDRAADICRDAFRREEVAPQALLEELMDIPGLPMHCPPHHFILPAVLLVTVGRAQGIPEAQFEEDLLEIWFPRIRDRDAAIFLYQGACWMLDCSDNELTSLDVSKNTNYLEEVKCSNNQLTSLNVSDSSVVRLFCDHNQLTALDLSKAASLASTGLIKVSLMRALSLLLRLPEI